MWVYLHRVLSAVTRSISWIVSGYSSQCIMIFLFSVQSWQNVDIPLENTKTFEKLLDLFMGICFTAKTVKAKELVVRNYFCFQQCQRRQSTLLFLLGHRGWFSQTIRCSVKLSAACSGKKYIWFLIKYFQMHFCSNIYLMDEKHQNRFLTVFSIYMVFLRVLDTRHNPVG